MKILIVGSGGREHALAWRLARGGHAVSAAPGNPGIATVAACHPVAVGDLDGQLALATRLGVDLVVVGPEAPLVAGLADRLRAAGVPTFGPGADGARSSRAPRCSPRSSSRATAFRPPAFAVCASVAEADARDRRAGRRRGRQGRRPRRGQGRGRVRRRVEEARAAARQMLEGRRFGAAGDRAGHRAQDPGP